tara:strand:- start:304 stop:948 length:645 start_codon:yes stop_codon:yes gene_type:complete
MAVALNKQDLSEAKKLAKLVRTLNLSGHNPATSGNYSLRSTTSNGYALVSESGIDKSLFTEDNLILVDIASSKQHEIFLPLSKKSSDETALHLAVYKATGANCVLHSHMLEGILFAELFPGQDFLRLSGMELLKGLKGISTHDTTVEIPCFENTQDIETLGEEVQKVINNNKYYSIILRGHGMYVWGDNVDSAKRHLEVFEYLFKYYLALKGIK